MLRRLQKLPSLPLALVLLSLLTASCGDLQDPASSSSAHITAGPDTQPPYLTSPSLDPASQEPTSIPAAPGVPASDPVQQQPSPGIDDQSGNRPTARPDSSSNVSPAEQSGNVPALPTGSHSILRRVTLAWDPSASGNSAGYRVSVRSDSTVAPYYYDAGLATELTVSLLAGTRYWFTVVAYNAAGESPPAEEFSFMLQ